ncbi:MAG: polymorphic toxin-type HINT domain-containing protein [Planctomycetota bacterium]
MDAYTVTGELEVLASAGMALGDVSGARGVDLSTPAALQATSVTSSAGSIDLFAGSALSLAGGSITAHQDLSITTRGVITAGQLTTLLGDISIATQSSFGTASDAGGDLYIAALGSITTAAYHASDDVTLMSLGDILNDAGSIFAGEALRLLAKGDINASNVTADTIALLHAEGDVDGTFGALTKIDRVLVHGDMTATLTEAGATYIYDEPDQPGVEPLIWSVKGDSYSLDRVRADLTSLDETQLSLTEKISKSRTGITAQQAAVSAGLGKTGSDLGTTLANAVASIGERFDSVVGLVVGGAAAIQAEIARTAADSAVGMSRGVTDSQATLADQMMQIADSDLRSEVTMLQISNGLVSLLDQLVDLREDRFDSLEKGHQLASDSIVQGKAFRDAMFDHAARAAIESIEEVHWEKRLDRIQVAISILGIAPGKIGIAIDLANAVFSAARGNWQDAFDHAVYAIPFYGTVFGLGQLTFGLIDDGIQYLQGVIEANQQGFTHLDIQHAISWVSGPGGGNSFVAGTGVVTGVDEDGNLITTAIEDLEVGDVVLAGNELDPTDPTSYELVTATSHRTVHELTEVTYVDDQGNVEVIKATDNHEFYVENTGWVKAEALQQGALLRLADGRTATVTSTTPLDVPEGVEVYNLTVANGKTYFVDDGYGHLAAAWVHNSFRDVAAKFDLIPNTKRYRVRNALGKGDYKEITEKMLKEFQGDHILPLAAINRALRGVTDQVKINKVWEIAGGSKNLRLLESSLNASKGARTAAQWATTPLGRTVSTRYLKDVAKIQEKIAKEIKDIIGETTELDKFIGQVIKKS